MSWGGKLKKPIIGISLDLASDNGKYSYAPSPWYALRKDYSDIVTKFGGIPMMLPYSSKPYEIVDAIDGLIISGGDEDINPQFYGQEIISDKVKTNNIRAEFEMNLVKKAMESNIPVFGICNGIQVINVVMGGTLIQHIPDTHNSDINHEQPAPKNIPTHPIIIKKGTLLDELSHNAEVLVNTTHHQAIDEIGKGLVISAKAPDGIIEAIESKNHRFVVGVQWHSEYENSELDSNLFKKLVEESAKKVY